MAIDEVLEDISQLPLRKGDMKNSGKIEIDSGTNQVIWKEDQKFDTTFTAVRDYAL